MCVIYYDKTIIAVFSAVKYLYNKLKIIRFILILLLLCSARDRFLYQRTFIQSN